MNVNSSGSRSALLRSQAARAEIGGTFSRSSLHLESPLCRVQTGASLERVGWPCEGYSRAIEYLAPQCQKYIVGIDKVPDPRSDIASETSVLRIVSHREKCLVLMAY